jgi:soluble lytic murein transglycosylase-like protein
MDLLIAATCALIVQPACPSAPPSKSPQLKLWQPEIDNAAANFGLPGAWVKAVMARESGGRTTLQGQPIRSTAGAMGLMQLMPKTYRDMRQRFALGADPDNPRDNIAAGTAYLHQMYVRYGYPNMFAAYNAGPGRFDAYLLHNKPLPDETIRYVQAIVPGAGAAFGVVAEPAPTPNSLAPPVKRNGLFFESGTGIGLASGANRLLFVTLSTPHS